MRITHSIKHIAKNERPLDIIFWDVETTQTVAENGDTINHFWFLVTQCVHLNQPEKYDTKVFFSLDDFWQYVMSKTGGKKKLWMIALNTDFDFRMSQGFHYLRQYGFYIHTLIDESHLFILEASTKCKYKGRSNDKQLPEIYTDDRCICILDTLNWFKASVAELGSNLALEKLAFPAYTDTIDQWIPYCNRDVDIIRLTFDRYIKFLNLHDMGNFAYTMAGQSFNCYRHRFMPTSIIIHTIEPVIKIERDAYFGGRTECFYIGQLPKKVYYKLDINSMYPYVMKQYKYPSRLLSDYTKIIPSLFYSTRKTNLIIARGMVTTKVPCVPKRYKGKLIFPVGTFETTLCSPEIELLEAEGGSFKPIEFSIYKPCDLFSGYIDYFYKLRLQYKSKGNVLYQMFTKLLMNSLYGKFGQKQMVWNPTGYLETEYTGVDYTLDGETGEEKTVKYIQGQIWEQQGEQEGYNSLVAIPAFITSYARCLLFKYIKIAGKSNVYYCDTDSLFVNQKGYDLLQSVIDVKELGMLKVEAETDCLQIRNLKDYTFGAESHTKGLQKNAVKVAENTYQVQNWERLNSAIRKDRVNNVVIIPVTKHITGKYNKGEVGKTGKVKPYRFKIGYDDPI